MTKEENDGSSALKGRPTDSCQRMIEGCKSELDANASPLNGETLSYNSIDITIEHENSIIIYSKEMARTILQEAKMESHSNVTKRC